MRDSSLRRNTSLTFSAISRAHAGRSRSSSVKIARTCDAVTPGFFPPQPPPFPLQEPQGQKRQRHVVVPAHPRAHLVVVQPHLLAALLQQLLPPVTPPVGHHHRRQRNFLGRVARRVPRPRLLLTAPDHHQPLARAHP